MSECLKSSGNNRLWRRFNLLQDSQIYASPEVQSGQILELMMKSKVTKSNLENEQKNPHYKTTTTKKDGIYKRGEKAIF